VKPKVLLLGSNGFIGSALKVHLSSYYEIMVFKNRNIDSLGNLSKTTIDYVVNCSASKLSDNFEESYNANIGFQISVFSKLFQECVQIPKWIQVASYYELQTFFGRSDNYSNHKKIFRRILETAYPLGSLNY
jgi:dTDP-4-dehydrorhamnose reductase